MKKIISIALISASLVACQSSLDNSGAKQYNQSKLNDDMLLKSLAIYQGIDIEGVNMAGANKLVAEKLLKEKYDSDLDKVLHLKYKDEDFTPTFRDLGYKYDYKLSIDEAYSKAREGESEKRLEEIKELKSNPISINLQFKQDEEVAKKYLEEISKKVKVDATGGQLYYDADEDKLKAGEGNPGSTIDIEDAIAKLKGLSLEEELNIELVSKEVLINPELEALAESIDGPIGSSVSNFNPWFWERVENIRVSTNELNGVVIEPGETFSFNDYIGDTPLERGYQYAVVINGTTQETGLGGGVCQTSTALYHSALYAGLEIVERHPHTLIMSYSEGGLDAAVDYGIIDLKIKNPYDFPVLVKTYYQEGEISFEIWGDTSKKTDEYAIYSHWNYDIPYYTNYVYSSDLGSGEEAIDVYGVVGSGWSAYRENLSTGEVEYLGDTVYPAVNQVIEQG